MATFLRTVLVQNRDELADRTFQEDLPVNPLSQILFTLRALKNGVDVDAGLNDLFAMVPDLAVTFRGQDVIRGSLQDLAVLNAIVSGWVPNGYAQLAGDNTILSLTVPLGFSRVPYWREEAFPASRRGDLILEVQVDAAVGQVDGLNLQIETTELLEEAPMRFLKYARSQQTFVTTGQERVPLPIGNPLFGVMLFGTTVPTAALRTATWEQLRLKIDNVEAFYARANWDSLHGELRRRLMGDARSLQEHVHRFNGAAAAFADTLSLQRGAVDVLEQYAYLDFDPLKDGEFALDTRGRADVQIQRDAGTADLGRFYPIEMVTVGGAGAAAA